MSTSHSPRYGRYEVQRELGRGAMGVVYLADDPVIGREVAIKVLSHAGLDDDEVSELQDRFRREFQSAGTLSHPNIVTVYDVGQEDHQAFIAMEYVPGESLASLLEADKDLSDKEIADLAYQIASGLDFAHKGGVVHRDVKPANLLLTWDGRTKIADFGVAKYMSATLTRTGTILGTPSYMSPEQVTGGKITGASDQFSLAVILYQLLTGQRPFNGESPTAILYQLVHEDPPSPQDLTPRRAPQVEGVLLRGLAKKPEDRFPSCTEMVEALRAALGAAPVDMTIALGPGEAFPPEEERPAPGGLRWVWVLGALMVLAIGGTYLYQELGKPLLPLDLGLGLGSEEAEPDDAPPEDTEDGSEPLGPTVADGTTPEGAEGDAGDASFEENLDPAGDGSEDAAPPAPEPARASVLLESNPSGARVLLDGDQAGVTPMEVSLVEGTAARDLRLELDGHDPASLALSYEGLSEAQLQGEALFFPLEKTILPGVIAVDATYAVTVTVDGEPRGTGASQRLELDPGTYEVVLSAPEVFYRERRTVEISSERTATLSVPPAIPFSVTAVPGNCKVSIDGQDAGTTPILDLPVAAGRHDFVFEWPGLGKTLERSEEVSDSFRRINARPPA